MLEFDGPWRFNSPSELPDGAFRELVSFATRIADQGDEWDVLETFKSYFAPAAGETYHRSSSCSWAETDLQRLMSNAAQNAPLFIEAFYEACCAVKEVGVAVPDVATINRVLTKHETGFEVHPPRLIRSGRETASEPVRAPSVGEPGEHRNPTFFG